MSLLGFRAKNHPQQTQQRGTSLFPDLEDVTDEGDDRGTDPVLFRYLHSRYGFTIDVAASVHNTKCERFFTLEDDGLAQSWAGERVWCNPPYSDIRPWVAKAHVSEAELVVMLLPANRTEQDWWQTWIEPYRDRGHYPLRVEFLAGRPRFVQKAGTTAEKGSRPPFGCCLAIWSWSDAV